MLKKKKQAEIGEEHEQNNLEAIEKEMSAELHSK